MPTKGCAPQLLRTAGARQFGGVERHLSCVRTDHRDNYHAGHNCVQGGMMPDANRKGYFWTHRAAVLGMGGLLFLGGYLTALWAPFHTTALSVPAPAAEERKEPGHMAPPEHQAHEVDLAPFMIRNAYHFATLYHAAQAARWELAAHEVEELEENATQAARAAGPYAPFLKDYVKDYIQPLQQAVTARQTEPFRTAFQAAVDGCNDCHRATKHAFITIPQEPPQLSIFVFPPAGR